MVWKANCVTDEISRKNFYTLNRRCPFARDFSGIPSEGTPGPSHSSSQPRMSLEEEDRLATVLSA